MDGLHDILLQRLINKGLSRDVVPAFIRNLTRTIYANPDISIHELNRRLDWPGWNQIEIDTYTLDLILADGVLQDLGAAPQNDLQRAS